MKSYKLFVDSMSRPMICGKMTNVLTFPMMDGLQLQMINKQKMKTIINKY